MFQVFESFLTWGQWTPEKFVSNFWSTLPLALVPIISDVCVSLCVCLKLLAKLCWTKSFFFIYIHVVFVKSRKERLILFNFYRNTKKLSMSKHCFIGCRKLYITIKFKITNNCASKKQWVPTGLTKHRNSRTLKQWVKSVHSPFTEFISHLFCRNLIDKTSACLLKCVYVFSQ